MMLNQSPARLSVFRGLRRSAAVLLMLGGGGCGALRGSPPAIDRSQDERIRSEVEERIAADPALASQSIRVDVDGAMVTLYGSVSGIDAWNCAIRNAQLVDGVGSVVEYLVIERGPRVASCGAGSSR